jgi:glyoxylate/hydroxypyruvate reductase A
MALHVLLQLPEGKPEPWLGDLRTALARAGLQAEVHLWSATSPGAPSGEAPADYALGWKPPARLFASQPRLKAFFNLGAGVDWLLALARDQPGLIPPHTRLVRLEDAGMGEQMVDYALHWVLHFYRRFDEYARSQAAGEWRPRAPRRKAGFTVGVLGVGHLGQQVGQALVANGFAVRGWATRPKPGAGFPVMTPDSASGTQKTAPGAEFLNGLSVLINLLPLTPATTSLLDAALFAQLPPGAVVINLARGAHLVEADLLAALDGGPDRGGLHAAVLDVLATEPLPPGHPFWRHPKVTITPHISAITLRPEAVAQVVGKLAALERGESISGVVDLGKGY